MGYNKSSIVHAGTAAECVYRPIFKPLSVFTTLTFLSILRAKG